MGGMREWETEWSTGQAGVMLMRTGEWGVGARSQGFLQINCGYMLHGIIIVRNVFIKCMLIVMKSNLLVHDNKF